MHIPTFTKLSVPLGLSIAVLGLPAIGYIYAPYLILRGFSIHYFFLGLAFLLILSRYGKTTLGKERHEQRTSVWISKIWGIELLWSLVFISTNHVIQHAFHLPLSSSWNQFKWLGGFYPWPLTALLATALGWLSYQAKSLPLLSSLIPNLKNTYYDTTFKRMIVMISSMAFILSLINTFVFSAIDIGIIVQTIQPEAIGYANRLSLLIVGIPLLLASQHPSTEKAIVFLCRKQISIGIIFLLLALIMAMLIVVSLGLTPILDTLLQTSFHLTHFDLTPLPTRIVYYHLLVWCWWLGLIIWVSSFIARLSAGRSIRQILWVTMGGPIGTMLILNTFNSQSLSLNHLPDLVSHGLAYLGLLLTLIPFLKTKDLQQTVTGFLPNPETNRLAVARRAEKILPIYARLLLILTIAYPWLGPTLVSFLLVLNMIPLLIIMIICLIGFYVYLSKHSIAVYKEF